MVVPKEDNIACYGSGTRHKADYRFANQVGSDNPDGRVNHANVLHGGEGPSSRKQEQTEEHVMMVGSWPCRVSSEIHING
jgi:hypothetical protein